MSQTTKSIKVLYFAIMKDECGIDSEIVETKAETPEALYSEIRKKYQLTIASKRLAVAINDEMSSWQDSLRSDDVVAFLPPVAGG